MAGSSLRTSPCSRTRTREPMWMSTITSRRALGRSRGLHSGENYLSLSTWYFWRCRIKNSLKIICFSQFLQSTHFRYGTTWCVSLSRTCQPICHHRSVIYNKSSLVSSLMPPQVALGRYCLKMIQLWNLVHTGEKTCSLASNPSHLGTFYRHLKIALPCYT